MAANRPLPRNDSICDVISGNSGLSVTPLCAHDFWDIDPPDDASARDLTALTDRVREELADEPYAFAYRDGWAMDPVLAISVVKIDPSWHWRGVAACLLSRHVKHDMVKVVNAFRRMLDAVPFVELHSSVAVNYEQGHRLVRALGYEQVRFLTQHSPSGADHILYRRFKNVHR